MSKKLNEMTKEELLALRVEMKATLKAINGLLKDVSYEGYVSMEQFASRVGIKLSSMRSRYMFYCLSYDIKWTTFEGDKGYYFKEEDVVKVVEGVEKKRMATAAKKASK